ncbi:sodium:solute symporter family protein [Sciscionella sediminilitoris]|uniref:sodium:solute symporter family protein n=1 Tax=Sciscionella sediminilitoris TaxID=1445613 RepID=UPI0004DF29BE|nr:sodium:solute symporter [Sciscionella sp. SE31]
MNAAVSIGILAAFLVLAVALGLYSARGRDRKALTEWSVGGRSFGTVFVWVLMAGETYTSFSFLGAAGWSYDKGVPIFYLVAYLAIGFAVGYVVGPLLWTYAHRHGLHNISDIVAHRFASPALGAGIAVLATVFLLPYIQVQITGMGVVVAEVSYGAIGLGLAYFLAFLITEAFLVVSGLRGSAWVSVLKDLLVVVLMVVIFVIVPLHFFDGYGQMFAKITEHRAQWLTLPGHGDTGLGIGWFVSTSVLNGVVIAIFPTTVAGSLAAANPQVVRRNAIFMPFYQILLFIPILLGFAASLAVPGLGNSDLSLFRMAADVLPSWLLGLLGVAGTLSAIVPMAVFMLVIGTMWGRSILGAHPRTANRQRPLAQLVAFLAGAIALLLTYIWPNALVRLSVVSYEGLAQLLPAVLLALLWRRMSAAAAVSGLTVGVVFTCVLVFTGNDPIAGINAGLLGLAANLLVVLAVTAIRPANTPPELLAQPETVTLKQ